jgi:hypothetical protein
MTSYIQETYSRKIFALPEEISFPVSDAEELPLNRQKFLPRKQKFNSKDIVEHTNGTIGGRLSLQFLPIPVDYSLIRSAWDVIRQTKNHAIADEARKILLVIQDTITAFHNFKLDLGYLPPLRAFNVDDGSVLLEWIFEDYRIGFSIESELQISSWYLVSNTNLGEIGASGYLSRVDIQSLILWLLNFVISHS